MKFEDEIGIRCFQDDPQLPIYSSLPSGYPVHELIEVLLRSDMPSGKLSTVRPLGVTHLLLMGETVNSIGDSSLDTAEVCSFKRLLLDSNWTASQLLSREGLNGGAALLGVTLCPQPEELLFLILE